MSEPLVLAPRSAFDGLLKPVGSPDAAGVIVRDRPELQVATVVARSGTATLAARLRVAYGLELATGPRFTAADRIALVGTGPRTWLALRDGGAKLAEELRRELGDAAAVFEQSGGYAVLCLSGRKICAAFEKGLSVDLHPRSFRPGDAAVTACSHIGFIIWQLDDSPAYEIAVFRSLAPAFSYWLSTASAEFGLRVLPTNRN